MTLQGMMTRLLGVGFEEARHEESNLVGDCGEPEDYTLMDRMKTVWLVLGRKTQVGREPCCWGHQGMQVLRKCAVVH